MGELLKNALLGWQAYITPGKLPVLLAVELLFCWLTGRKLGQKALVCYMGAMACVCVFPVTAVLLMVYQTKFYDYQWIWSTVPLTVVTAYGAVEILGSISEPWKRENLKKSIPGVFVLLAILFLCSGFGQEPVNPGEEIRERNRAEKVLAELPAEKGILLWAPADILEYARAEDSSVILLYGRNMWDKWLDAYSYDTYPEAMFSSLTASSLPNKDNGRGFSGAEEGSRTESDSDRGGRKSCRRRGKLYFAAGKPGF